MLLDLKQAQAATTQRRLSAMLIFHAEARGPG